jgi:hypothetical protein
MDKSESGTKAVIDVFKSLGVKLWTPPEKKPSKKYTLSKVIKKSSFNRTQYILIIKNWRKFYDEVKKVKPARANEKVQLINYNNNVILIIAYRRC